MNLSNSFGLPSHSGGLDFESSSGVRVGGPFMFPSGEYTITRREERVVETITPLDYLTMFLEENPNFGTPEFLLENPTLVANLATDISFMAKNLNRLPSQTTPEGMLRARGVISTQGSYASLISEMKPFLKPETLGGALRMSLGVSAEGVTVCGTGPYYLGEEMLNAIEIICGDQELGMQYATENFSEDYLVYSVRQMCGSSNFTHKTSRISQMYYQPSSTGDAFLDAEIYVAFKQDRDYPHRNAQSGRVIEYLKEQRFCEGFHRTYDEIERVYEANGRGGVVSYLQGLDRETTFSGKQQLDSLFRGNKYFHHSPKVTKKKYMEEFVRRVDPEGNIPIYANFELSSRSVYMSPEELIDGKLGKIDCNDRVILAIDIHGFTPVGSYTKGTLLSQIQQFANKGGRNVAVFVFADILEFRDYRKYSPSRVKIDVYDFIDWREGSLVFRVKHHMAEGAAFVFDPSVVNSVLCRFTLYHLYNHSLVYRAIQGEHLSNLLAIDPIRIVDTMLGFPVMLNHYPVELGILSTKDVQYVLSHEINEQILGKSVFSGPFGEQDQGHMMGENQKSDDELYFSGPLFERGFTNHEYFTSDEEFDYDQDDSGGFADKEGMVDEILRDRYDKYC